MNPPTNQSRKSSARATKGLVPVSTPNETLASATIGLTSRAPRPFGRHSENNPSNVLLALLSGKHSHLPKFQTETQRQCRRPLCSAIENGRPLGS